jgi:phosphate transport system substrate-binding protein
MWRKEKKYNSVIGLGMLLTLASTPIAATIFVSQFAVAQTNANEPSFPLPKTIPSGTTVKVDGSNSMAKINENLKQTFEQQFTGTKVELATNGTDTALKSLIDGKIDLAGIGRGLTSAEQAKGLEQKRVDRQKIAIVVGENNPFKGNLTNQQFAKIFRGEITDWSQLGGEKGKIKFIDRPTSSDTREAFRNYPAFKTANFATGSTATILSQDDTAELVKQLGKDGIGYVIANQASKVSGLRALKLHQTLPDDARYPFSQPFVYAYKKNPNPGVTGFLGFASGEPGIKAIATARSTEADAVVQGLTGAATQANATATATPSPSKDAIATQATATASPGTDAIATQANANATASPGTVPENTTNTSAVNQTSDNSNTGDDKQAFLPSGENVASSETGNAGFPWWWLLPIAALGAGGLWFLVGGKRRQDKEVINPATSTNSPEINPLPTQQNFATNITDSAATGISNAGNTALAGGAALAAGATASGIGLWSRLGYGEADALDEENISPEAEITNLQEPASVVMPPLTEVPNVELEEPVIDVNLPHAELPNIELPNTELPNVDATPEVNSPNWLDNLNAAGGTTLAGGVALTGSAAAAWSRFANRDGALHPSYDERIDETTDEPTNINLPDVNLPNIEQPDLTASIDVPEIPTIEISEPSVDLPKIPSAQLPDVSIQVPGIEVPEIETQTGGNLLDNITLAGGTALAGGAAAGAALWSRFANREPNADIPEADLNLSVDTPEIPEVPSLGVTTASIETPEVPDIQSLELTAPSIETPEIPDIPSPQINNLNATLPDVWDETPEETPESDRNLLGYITIAGGAAAAAAGLANHNREDSENTEITEENITVAEVDVTAPPLETPEIIISEAEVTEVTEFVPDADTTDNSVNLDNPTGDGVVLTGEIGSRNWWAPEDTIATETPETVFDAIADAAESTEDVMETETSFSENSPLDFPEESANTGLEINPAILAGGAVAGAGAAILAATSNSGNNNEQNVEPTVEPIIIAPTIEPTTSETPLEPVNGSTITLTPRTPKWAYATWNIADAEKEAKHHQGGKNLALRLYDTTGIDLSYQPAQLVQQYECEETIENRFIAIPISDRDYMAEIGYLTEDNSWLPIARSHVNRVFSRPHQEFWFEADAELIIHGATEPGSAVSIGGQTVKLKEDGTFHLRIPFTDDLIDYVMTAVANNGDNAKTIHMHFSQDGVKKEDENDK